MTIDLTDRYLDLLKKTLSFSLWDDPPVTLDALRYGGPAVRVVTGLCSGLLGRMRLALVMKQDRSDTARQTGREWPSMAHTMIGLRRLDNIQYCVETILKEDIPGDLIETGVWRGGASIFMRGILEAYGNEDRRVFVADSFQGLPPPDPRFPADNGDIHHKIGLNSIEKTQVEENFRKYDLLDDRVIFLEGWFCDTLPDAPIDRIAVLRFDGDMYGSTMDVLNNLYHKISIGGFCIIDDYALEPCKQAVHDFRQSHGITEPIEQIDWSGVYWRKQTDHR